jgi:N-hydroxyarylamine O-acetyltransferase
MSFNFASELDAYFARIGYSGPRTPTLATLTGIAGAHTRTIPFENLDVLLGRPIALDPEALVKKLIHDRRGGYCFEQNGLLLLVLETLGFAVTPLSARVRLQRPRDFIPTRTHLFLRVEIAGESWLADVGIGGLSLTAPIRLNTGLEQPTPHEPRRIVREGARLFHQVRLGPEWQDVCEFTLEEMPLVDRELANWWTSTHPTSRFRQLLVAARAESSGVRVVLQNRDFTIRQADGRADTRQLTSPAELLGVLAQHFNLHFPAGTRFACPDLVWPE